MSTENMQVYFDKEGQIKFGTKEEEESIPLINSKFSVSIVYLETNTEIVLTCKDLSIFAPEVEFLIVNAIKDRLSS